MKIFSLKALGAFIFAAGLVVAGVAGPANAAEFATPTATTTGTVPTSGTNTAQIVIQATPVTVIATGGIVSVSFPPGWSLVNGAGACTSRVSITGFTPTTCTMTATNAKFEIGNVTATPFTITFEASVFNVTSNKNFAVVSLEPRQGDGQLMVRDASNQVVLTSSGGGGGGGGGGGSPSANLTLNATTGQLIAGSTVGVSASGLQSTAAYTVTVQSTPQTIGSGNAVNGAVSTNVTLPSGLEAGWHTLTFASTAADGSAIESKYYFKISASGTLLSTSSTIPAELANTGINSATGISLLAGGFSLALVGAEMFMIARRKRSN